MPPQKEAPHLIHPKYRPDIDGLRAVAVVSVVGYHAFPDLVRGGFIGVDIFFVISGFLISTIIFGSLAGAGFSYREFYARRIRRIFPALLPVMAATFAFGWYVLLSDEFRQLGKHLLGSAGFVSNLVLWGEAGYFDTAAEVKPLQHLWSLAVEEQFYIFWPLLLGLVWRIKGPRGLMFWMTVAAGLSFLLNVGGVHRHADATFYSPLSRIWELAAGAMLALAAMRRTTEGRAVRGAQVRSVAGLVLLGLGLSLIQKDKAFPGWWAILPIYGTCLCISAGMGAWLNRVLLGSRPFVWVGLISYPLYLWHWPLLVFARIVEGGTPPLSIRVGAVAASVALAWLTYRFVERPIRRSEGPGAVRWLSIGMVVLAAIGIAAWSRALPPRNSDPTLQAIVSAGSDWGYPGELRSIEMDGQQLYRLSGGGKSRVLLLGDSHVEQYAPRAMEIARTEPGRLNDLYFATRGACAPIPNLVEDRDPGCAERVTTLLRFAMSPQIDTVVLGGCWACYFDVGPQPPPPGVPAVDHYYLREGGVRHMLRGGDGVERSYQALATSIRALKAAGKTVYLVLNAPVGPDFEPKAMISGGRLGTLRAANASPTVALTPSQQAIHDRLLRIANETGAIPIDPIAALCQAGGQCTRSDDKGVPIYKDPSHLRASFVERFATFFDTAVAQPR